MTRLRRLARQQCMGLARLPRALRHPAGAAGASEPAVDPTNDLLPLGSALAAQASGSRRAPALARPSWGLRRKLVQPAPEPEPEPEPQSPEPEPELQLQLQLHLHLRWS